jgi:hypothetical protein
MSNLHKFSNDGTYYFRFGTVTCTCLEAELIQCDKLLVKGYNIDLVITKMCDLLAENQIMKQEIMELRKELNELKTHVEYMPGGKGYLNAEKHFNETIEKISTS